MACLCSRSQGLCAWTAASRSQGNGCPHLHFIQARDPALVNRPFFARYDPDAVWLDDLRPAFADSFPF